MRHAEGGLRVDPNAVEVLLREVRARDRLPDLLGRRLDEDAVDLRRRELSLGRHGSSPPVSSSVFSPLSTLIHPTPETLAAVFGAPSSWSWTTVRSVTPSSPASISHETRLSSSCASSGLYSERQPCTSFRGGSNSNTSASPHTSPF